MRNNCKGYPIKKPYIRKKIRLTSKKKNISKKKYERVVNIEDKLVSTRSNDGGSDAYGRFWLGTMQNNFDKDGNDIPIKDNIGKLYKVDIDKNISVVEEDLGIPNTFIWSPDNKLFYFTDTLNGKILSYNFELESGELSNKKDFAKFERGHPAVSYTHLTLPTKA